MRYVHELVRTSDKVPAKVIIHRNFAGDVLSHWHRSIELTCLLEGKA